MIKKWIYIVFICCLFFGRYLSAEIIECTQVSELFSLVPNESLLFLEIDNVVLKPKEEVATTSFFDYLRQNLLREGLEPDQIVNKLYPLWVKVQKKSKSILADVNLPESFKLLKEKDVTVLAFSQCGPHLAYQTLDKLHALNIRFNTSEPFHQNFILEPELATFYEGMFLLHPICDKGEYIPKFLEQTNFSPTKVVCADYQLVNLVRLGQVFEQLEIPFLGIYCRNEDCNVSDYTIDIGNLQLEYLDKIMPDVTASTLLQGS
ncbi:MAG: hypothetical protein S4CHLAM6_01180 [Chlamydiae bacterium]|nr:hypothetical protein [Chlamydiota bacterium]